MDCRLLLALSGQLKPEQEIPRYWRVLYAWLIGGLACGMHRLVVDKVIAYPHDFLIHTSTCSNILPTEVLLLNFRLFIDIILRFTRCLGE